MFNFWPFNIKRKRREAENQRRFRPHPARSDDHLGPLYLATLSRSEADALTIAAAASIGGASTDIVERAEKLDARWTRGLKKHRFNMLFTDHHNARLTTDLGIRGIRLCYAQPKKNKGITSTPYFRVATGRLDGSRTARQKSYSILTRGLDNAWKLAVAHWANYHSLTVKQRDQVVRDYRPTLDHFEALAEVIHNAGFEIDVNRWIEAGIA
jgi:hypothetical protein